MLSQPLNFPDFPDFPDFLDYAAFLKITSKQTKASENMNCKLQRFGQAQLAAGKNREVASGKPKTQMKILATVEQSNSCCCCSACCSCYYCLRGDRLIGMGQLLPVTSRLVLLVRVSIFISIWRVSGWQATPRLTFDSRHWPGNLRGRAKGQRNSGDGNVILELIKHFQKCLEKYQLIVLKIPKEKSTD